MIKWKYKKGIRRQCLSCHKTTYKPKIVDKITYCPYCGDYATKV